MAIRFDLEICLGSSCFSRGNRDVVQFIKEYLRKNHLDDRVVFKGARCFGHCSNGPNMVINGKVIEGVTLDKVERILEENLAELK
jgi:NADH:ubiquinone oxidoreductase subunit E